ncbi:MAG: hypothetical protein QOG64_300 [Acidimicrobiaceae bacterium]|jgi:hypothetical protein|nr:hypothetical protein [Acidimicrobiaceae bacterium]
MRRSSGRCATTGVILFLAVLVLGGCSRGKKDVTSGHDQSVFNLKVGDCVLPPTAVKAEIDKVRVLTCTQPHTEEAFAVIPYDKGDVYPGDKLLRAFADGACLEKYQSYVGVAYTDSSLFYTYLLPSARGWSDGKDRNVICLVTTTGEKLTTSVKGSNR